MPEPFWVDEQWVESVPAPACAAQCQQIRHDGDRERPACPVRHTAAWVVSLSRQLDFVPKPLINSFVAGPSIRTEDNMGRALLLWLLGIPIPVIIIILLLWH
jgi:hypothetical protein